MTVAQILPEIDMYPNIKLLADDSFADWIFFILFYCIAHNVKRRIQYRTSVGVAISTLFHTYNYFNACVFLQNSIKNIKLNVRKLSTGSCSDIVPV
jgi:hypothetical protein